MRYFKVIIAALALLVAAPAATAQVHKSKSYIKKTTVIKEEKKKPKKPESRWPKMVWYGRVGCDIPFTSSMSGSEITCAPGLDVDFGFQHRMGRYGWYWGMDAAFVTRNVGFKSHTVTTTGNDIYGQERDALNWTFPSASWTGVGGRINFINIGWRYNKGPIWAEIHGGLGMELGQRGGVKIQSNEAYTGIYTHDYNHNGDYNDDQYAMGKWTTIDIGMWEATFGVGFRYKKLMIDASLRFPTDVIDYNCMWQEPGITDKGWGDSHHNEYFLPSMLISVGYVF